MENGVNPQEQEHQELTLEVMINDIGPAFDSALKTAAKIAASIVDDASKDSAIGMAEQVKAKLDTLTHEPDEEEGDPGGLRERYYVPAYRHAEDIRALFDGRIKEGRAIVKTIMAGVSEFNVKKEREARIARERAEAEARRIQEEADRKRREAEEAARKAKAAAEAEAKLKKDAEEAEARRVQAEKEAKERADREAREAAAKETARKIKEEEDGRLAHAQEAQDVGSGHKVGTILETQTPISPVLAGVQAQKDSETLRLESEQAEKATREKAELDRRASEEAEAKRKEAEDAADRAKADADAADAAAATAAAAAAATAIVTRPDSRTTAVSRFKWDLDSDGTVAGDKKAFMFLAKAVVEERAPIEYLFDPEHPEKFRPQAINEDVQRLREAFTCPGLKVYQQRDEQLRRRRG